MSRFIAYLRAINVGGHVVKMDQLKILFQQLELANVETFIASGNVIFDSPARSADKLERKIEDHLGNALGYAVATFLRTTAENVTAAAHEPFAAVRYKASSRLYAAFLKAAPTAAQSKALLAFKTEIDEFVIHDRELYWLCHVPSHESAFSAARAEKTLGAPITMRNINTVRKLAAKYPPA